jgi:hypothetical protein
VVLAVMPAWLVKVQPVPPALMAPHSALMAPLVVLVVPVVLAVTAAPAVPVALVVPAAAAPVAWVSLQLAVQVGTVGSVVLALMPRP